MSTAESRKVEELKKYEELYAEGKNTGVTPFRQEYFSDSDDLFKDLIVKHCKGKKVLEIGCGLGFHSIYTANFAKEVVGTDVSEEAVKAANKSALDKNLSNVSFEIQDAESLSYEDNSFDAVINHEVFSSIDISKVLPELARVLKSGGVIISKETFGHNLVFNFKRKLNHLFGRRTDWSVNNIWREESYKEVDEYFTVPLKEYFHILILFFFPLYFLPIAKIRKPILSFIKILDQKLLNLSFLKRQAFKTVFILQKK